MKKVRVWVSLIAVVSGAIMPFVSSADASDLMCFYLDKDKLKGNLLPVRLMADSDPALELQKRGLIRGDQRLCQWSLNGGSGVREAFALDGEFAVPILDRDCESPFSHIYTGVGFGDWHLTFCASRSGNNLIVSYKASEYFVPVDSLEQWTEYPPGEFPVE